MPIVQLLGLVVFAVLLSAGQIVLKIAAIKAPPLTSGSALVALLQVPWLWAGLLLYGTATLLWISLMQQVPLSRGYPFAALGFIVVPASGILLFNERVSASYVAGALLIVAGLLLISRS